MGRWNTFNYTLSGVGLIVDIEKGWVVTDKAAIPTMLGDAEITFGGSLRIPEKVLAIHPLHNMSLLQYDTELLKETLLIPASIEGNDLEAGEPVVIVGQRPDGGMTTTYTRVSEISELNLSGNNYPVYQDINAETAELSLTPGYMGAVLNERGSVSGLFSRVRDFDGEKYFYRNVITPSHLIQRFVDDVESGSGQFSDLGVTLDYISLADAREAGLSDIWIERLISTRPDRRVRMLKAS